MYSYQQKDLFRILHISICCVIGQLPKHRFHSYIDNICREKVFVLTEKGISHFSEFMTSMNTVEEQAVALMGNENMQLMTQMLMQYNLFLKKSIVQYIKEKSYDEEC